jgi:hypothetical protein
MHLQIVEADGQLTGRYVANRGAGPDLTSRRGNFRSDSVVRASPLMSDNATTRAVAARGRLQTSRDPISNQACEVMRAEG